MSSPTSTTFDTEDGERIIVLVYPEENNLHLHYIYNYGVGNKSFIIPLSSLDQLQTALSQVKEKTT